MARKTTIPAKRQRFRLRPGESLTGGGVCIEFQPRKVNGKMRNEFIVTAPEGFPVMRVVKPAAMDISETERQDSD
jgi:hypothetical protein